MHLSGLVSGRKVDVPGCDDRAPFAPLAPRFPDGEAEQITFGPTDEEGIAVAPDGHSLVTSVGTRRSSVWIHSPSGERAISSEGYAVAPHFSRDGRHVFYLLRRISPYRRHSAG